MVRQLCLATLAALAALTPAAAATVDPPPIRLTVLYDNWVAAEPAEADWGFALLVERAGATVLFDTGAEASVLNRNLERLGVDLAEVDAVVLSHDHGDHTGGLFSVLAANPRLTVFAPSSFSSTFAEEVQRTGARVVIDGKPHEIAAGLHTTGTTGEEIPEQALVVDTADGLMVVTGCAHPGVVTMVRGVAETFAREVHTVVGGFHLIRHSPEEVAEVMAGLEELGVRRAGPSHCSGKPAADLFRETFGDRFVALGAGRVVEMAAATTADAGDQD